MHFIEVIHQKAIQASKNYKRAEGELLSILEEVDTHKVFRELGFSSLYDYCLRALGLSESVSYNFMVVARKAKEVPLLKKEITEKEVAAVCPEAATLERIRFIQKDRLQFQCGISEELMKKLKRAQDILCQKKKMAVSLEETLEAMAELYLEKEDPLRKTSKKPDLSQVGRKDGKRTVASIHIQRAVIQRDEARCTFINQAGKRCEETRWLQPSHLGEVAQKMR